MCGICVAYAYACFLIAFLLHCCFLFCSFIFELACLYIYIFYYYQYYLCRSAHHPFSSTQLGFRYFPRWLRRPPNFRRVLEYWSRRVTYLPCMRWWYPSCRSSRVRKYVSWRTHVCAHQNLAQVAPQDQRAPTPLRYRVCSCRVCGSSACHGPRSQDFQRARDPAGRVRLNRIHHEDQSRGPLIVYKEDNGVTWAFRNLPGVELYHVSRLNLLQLAPGAHLLLIIFFLVKFLLLLLLQVP